MAEINITGCTCSRTNQNYPNLQPWRNRFPL